MGNGRPRSIRLRGYLADNQSPQGAEQIEKHELKADRRSTCHGAPDTRWANESLRAAVHSLNTGPAPMVPQKARARQHHDEDASARAVADEDHLEHVFGRAPGRPGVGSSQRVPGAMPCSGKPSASPQENPQPRHISRFRGSVFMSVSAFRVALCVAGEGHAQIRAMPRHRC